MLLPIWPAGGYSRAAAFGSTQRKTGPTSAKDLDDPHIARQGNEGGSTVRSSRHESIPPEVNPPTRHGVAGGRPQMAYHHINLSRR